MADLQSGDVVHLSDSEIAAYLDRGLAAADRDRAEEHFASCKECRAHLVSSRRLLERVNQPRRFLVTGISIAAAAAVMFLVLRPEIFRNEQHSVAPIVRGSDAADSRLMVYGPIGESRTGGTRFIWAAASGALSYRINVTRADGAAVWSHGGTDTSVALPDSVALRAGQRYFWTADAVMEDGTTRTTGMRELDPVP
jgi:hypothetical protein